LQLNWPKVCARCGTTENLHGENVSVQRQKQEKVGPKQYRTYDVTFTAHIYLCTECESIAKQEYERLLPVRKNMSKILLALALITSLLSLPLLMVYMTLIPNILVVLLLTFILPCVFWTLVFSNWGADKNFELSGYRRFFFDWTLDGPLRFTNKELMDAVERENPYERGFAVRHVEKISRGSIETPDSGDCCSGLCLGLIIVFVLFFIWAVMTGVYDPMA
jgi:hypothetical protein